MPTTSSSSKPRLLWLDDDVIYLDAIRDTISDRVDVTLVTSAEDAIARLKADPAYNAIVTDLVLSPNESDGLGFIKFAKTLLPKTPLIAVSAFSARYTRELSALGVDALLDKSELNTASLMELIDSIIRTPVAAPHPNLEFVREREVRRIVEEEIRRLVPEKERTLDLLSHGRYELIKPLVGYKKDIERQLLRFPFEKNVFLMMKFRANNVELGEFIIECLARTGLCGVRADQDAWNITRNIYNPIAVLYCCKFGIALFDEAEAGQAYSPNVAYELGMMHYQGKECLVLRHTSLPSVPFDLIKDLYQDYSKDLQVRAVVERWVRQIAS